MYFIDWKMYGNIIMNMKTTDGTMKSLFSCGISSRGELRNYVEVNDC